jgi:hypothetical protein
VRVLFRAMSRRVPSRTAGEREPTVKEYSRVRIRQIAASCV